MRIAMSLIEIDVGKEFSPAPAGRNYGDGPNSGEKFRCELLSPNLKTYETVIVHLDTTEGYGSSFLEEAFGGLVRNDGYEAQQLLAKLKLDTDDEFLLTEIIQYINDAGLRK